MKSQITIFCDNAHELQEFARRILNVPAEEGVAHIPPAVIENLPGFVPAIAPTPEPEAPKTRKPRADAGKPRGPYKTTTENTTTGEPAASEPATTADSVAVPAAAPATPTTPAAPPAPVAQAQEAQRADSAPAAAADPTLDDARAALKRISATKGLAMEGCMQHLKDFGTDRITLLPKEKYAAFIKAADEKIAALQK